jgi:hypothetical protein
MAVATATAIAIGVTAAAGAAQAVQGAKRAKEAKKALENFQRQELQNVAKDLRVSTLGAEMQTLSATRQAESTVQALRSGGVRGIVGGAGQVGAQQAQVQQQISADLDRQEAARQQAIAQEESNIRGMKEKRESTEIAGLGQEMAAGREQMWTGIQGVASSAAALGQAIPDAAPKIEGAGTAALQKQAAGSQFFAGLSPEAQAISGGSFMPQIGNATRFQPIASGLGQGSTSTNNFQAPTYNKSLGFSNQTNPFTSN